jgi:replicative DNA helicase
MRKRSEARLPAREWEIAVPNDVVNEQVLLAAMLVDEGTCDRILKAVPIDAFYAKEHRALVAALAEMRRRKLSYDPATLARIAGDSVDPRLVEQLGAARPDIPANLDAHVTWALWDQQRAQATRGPIAALLEAVQNPKELPERVRALARQVGHSFEGAAGRGRFLHDPKELVRDQMAKIRARAEGRASFPLGIPGLDLFEDGKPRLAIGAMPGKCTVVTALSGSGKTTLTANLALGLGRQRRRVLWGAWEVDGGMNLETMATISLGWSRSAVLRGELSPEDLITFEERMHAIGKQVMFMRIPFRRNAGERNTNAGNLDVVQAHVEESGCDIFIADLWTRCLADKRPEAEEEALFRQQAMLEETQVHGILLHQQRSKDIEQRPDKRPTREGIKGSSALLEVADTMIAPHLPALWKNIPDDKMEVFVLKQRFGKWPLGVELEWDGDRGSIAGGRSIPYNQPGEGGDDLPGWTAPKGRGNGGGKRARYA